MRLKNRELWIKFLKDNRDPFSHAVARHALRWAELMEEDLEDGLALSDIAVETCREADTEKITPHMRCRSLDLLISMWEYGDALKTVFFLEEKAGADEKETPESTTNPNPTLLIHPLAYHFNRLNTSTSLANQR